VDFDLLMFKNFTTNALYWRVPMILKSVIAIVVLLITALFITTPVMASEPTENPMTVIVIDGSTLRQDPETLDATRSLITILSTMIVGREVAFIDAERPSNIIGPISFGEPGFGDAINGIEAELTSGNTNESTIFDGIVQAGTLLGLERSTTGSNVILITNGSSDQNTNSDYKRIIPLVNRFKDQAHGFHMISVGKTVDATKDFGMNIVNLGRGKFITLEKTDDIKDIIQSLISDIGVIPLEELNSSELSVNDMLSVSVDVLPETEHLRFFIYLENALGSVRLINPDGIDSLSIDGTHKVESPYIHSWEITDPEPGTWFIDVNNVDGGFAAWMTSLNNLHLSLNNSGPIPVNEPTSLVAYANRGSNLVKVKDAKMFAYITTPSGKRLTYTLNDFGADSDTVAGDGYFSGSVGPFNSTGKHEITLELVWESAEYVMTSDASINIENFPSIEVQMLGSNDLKIGQKTKVASIMVNVNSEPYPVFADDINWDLSSGDSTAGLLEIQPSTADPNSQDWMYDVFLTVDSAGQRTLSLGLKVNYAGKDYIYNSDPLFFSSVAPEQIINPVLENTVVNKNISYSGDSSNQFPWWVLVFPASILIVSTSMYASWKIKVSPAGYIYNDRDERIIDFSDLKRGLLNKILFKNKISGKELSMVGFEGVTFNFNRDKISINTKVPSTSVRVDNKPLSKEVELMDQTWIGVRGKLYNFVAYNS